MQPLMSNVDKQIGRLVAAYGRAGILPQTTFVITSDHGMVPALHTVDSEQIKSIVLKAGGDPLYIGHGDSSSIWLKNPETIQKVKTALVERQHSERGRRLCAKSKGQLCTGVTDQPPGRSCGG